MRLMIKSCIYFNELYSYKKKTYHLINLTATLIIPSVSNSPIFPVWSYTPVFSISPVSTFTILADTE